MEAKISYYVNILCNLLALLDDPTCESVPVEQIRAKLVNGSLFDWLIGRFDGGYRDLSIIQGDPKWQASALARLRQIAGEDPADLFRHYWVENNGVCVLARCILEVINRELNGQWEDFASEN